MNIADGILQERDRLTKIKECVAEDWNKPEFFFYRAVWDNLMKRANEALGGHMDIIEMTALCAEMQEFEA